MKDYFPGFERMDIDTGEVVIHTLKGGSGKEAVLLLHGHPENHLMWRGIATQLAERYTVVLTDLRGYGQSSKPPGDDNHENYSKRAMARDQVKVMDALGIDRFYLAGHDRGARVAHRLVADYPDWVIKCSLMDILPTYDMYKGTNQEFATYYWHWFFYIQPDGLPERLLGGPNAEYFVRYALGCPDEGDPERKDFDEKFPPEVVEEYIKSYANPASLHAICEDYRACATIDMEHDEADRPVKLTTPLQVLWAAEGICDALWDVLSVWRERAENVSGFEMHCNHFLPEQKPNEVLEALQHFFQE